MWGFFWKQPARARRPREARVCLGEIGKFIYSGLNHTAPPMGGLGFHREGRPGRKRAKILIGLRARRFDAMGSAESADSDPLLGYADESNGPHQAQAGRMGPRNF